ncbi:hypothetical protein [Streptomyces sp. NPDC002587]
MQVFVAGQRPKAGRCGSGEAYQEWVVGLDQAVAVAVAVTGGRCCAAA